MASNRMTGTVPGFLSGLVLMIFSGSVATIAFDIWGQAISPGLLAWANLAPVPLATQTVAVLFGVRSEAFGNFMHLFLVGLVAYPFGYLYIFRPLQERVVPRLGWPAGGALYGFALFWLAIGIVAGPLIAGNPWFLDWTDITWVAMIGHTLYGLVLAACIAYLERLGI